MAEPEVNPTLAFIAIKRFLEKLDTGDTLGMLNLVTWNAMHHLKKQEGDPTYPFTAAPVMQYATQAALLSGSDKPRNKFLNGDGLCWTIQMAHEVLSPPHLPGDMISHMSLEDLTTHLFAPMVRHQGRLQNQDFLWTAAQQWQLFNVIPRRDAEVLRRRAGGDYIDIPAEIEKRTGLPVEDVFAVASAIYAMNMTGTKALSTAMQSAPSILAPHEKLKWFVDEARRSGRPLATTFTVQDLQTVLKDDTPSRARAWLKTFSAPPSRLKLMAENDRRYNSGEITFQVLPLEAIPVVKLGGGRYVVPNAHSLIMGLPHLCELHALLNWPAREWQQLRATLGIVQEIYLEEFTSSALSSRITIIPEREYRRPGDRNIVRGPDLTIIEDGSAVLVESKAMLFADVARVGAGVAPFEAVDRKMSDVVLKSDWKADDLLNPDVHTYDQYRKQLNTVNPARVITVIVHAEHLHGYNITWRARRRDPGHPLHGHASNFIALSLEEYTHFVDAARETGRSLFELLSEQINEIEAHDIGFDRSVIEGVDLNDSSVLRKQFVEYMDAVKQRWLSAGTGT